jgi:hypothetical protein
MNLAGDTCDDDDEGGPGRMGQTCVAVMSQGAGQLSDGLQGPACM